MLIEVTEKEAIEIYSQRYIDNKGKVKNYLPVVLFFVAVIAGASILTLVNDWLGVAVFIVLSSPVIFMSLKVAKASGKYARSQIEGLNKANKTLNELLGEKEQI